MEESRDMVKGFDLMFETHEFYEKLREYRPTIMSEGVMSINARDNETFVIYNTDENRMRVRDALRGKYKVLVVVDYI